jgi:hypothetical protein
MLIDINKISVSRNFRYCRPLGIFKIPEGPINADVKCCNLYSWKGPIFLTLSCSQSVLHVRSNFVTPHVSRNEQLMIKNSPWKHCNFLKKKCKRHIYTFHSYFHNLRHYLPILSITWSSSSSLPSHRFLHNFIDIADFTILTISPLSAHLSDNRSISLSLPLHRFLHNFIDVADVTILTISPLSAHFKR